MKMNGPNYPFCAFPSRFRGPDSRSRRAGRRGGAGVPCAALIRLGALAPTPRGAGPAPAPRGGLGRGLRAGGRARPGLRAHGTARDVPSDFAVTSTKSFYRSGLRCTRHVERALFTRFVYKLHVLPLARVRSTLYTPKTQLRGLGGTLYSTCTCCTCCAHRKTSSQISAKCYAYATYGSRQGRSRRAVASYLLLA